MEFLNEVFKQLDDRTREGLALLVALAAVVVGPLIQLLIARRSIRAEVRSSNRMVWIGTLRGALTDYLSLCSRIVRLRTHFLEDQKSGTGQSKPPDISKELEEADKIFTNIRLLLNPDGDDENELLEKLKQFSSFIQIRTIEEFLEYKKSKEEVVKQAQEILKTEWERVKRVE